MLGTLIIAIKFNEDEYFSNNFYAKVGGIRMEELNRIESEAFYLLNYNLYIDINLYYKYEIYLKLYKITEKKNSKFTK